MAALTRWVLAHKKTVVFVWLVVTIAAFAAVQPTVDALSEEFSVPGREGFETNQEVLITYGTGGAAAPVVPVVTLPEGTTVDSPGIAEELAAALDKVDEALPAARIVSYASTGDSVFVSEDRATTFAIIFIPESLGFEAGRAEAEAAQAALEGVTVGGAPVQVTGLEALRGEGEGGEEGGPSVLLEVMIGGAGALVILAFVFASFMALIPLLMAIIAIPTTFLLIWPLTAITDVSTVVQFLVALIGLGVAIDYALLVVMRWREERQSGDVDNDTAVQRAMEHAGAAVVFSGTTVAIGLLALVILPLPFLRSIGIAGMLIPLVSTILAITLLPVLLATIGPRMDWPRIRREDRASRLWTAWARLVVRHKWVAFILSGGVLLALVVTAFQIQVGSPRAESLAQSGTAREAFDSLADSGIGAGPLSPFEVLVRDGEPEAVAISLNDVEGVRGAVAPTDSEWQQGGTALVTVVPIEDGNSGEGRATLDRVRAEIEGEGSDASVGGQAAQSSDFVDAVYGNFPLMIALIAGLSFILLVRAFRSIVLPLKAVLLNILSVAAAWGLMVLIWQKGYGSDLIWGIEATGSITEWVPLMVFAFLFGLSMDYQVFIIARMREGYDRSNSTSTAIVEGIGRTGRLVTSAALILFLAFLALSASPGTEIKIFATALALGILLDATIIRAVLVPAAVAILGSSNWVLPASVARLLRVAPSPDRSARVAEDA
jgi:RND superfamily putative drug exporter